MLFMFYFYEQTFLALVHLNVKGIRTLYVIHIYLQLSMFITISDEDAKYIAIQKNTLLPSFHARLSAAKQAADCQAIMFQYVYFPGRLHGK